MWKRAVLKEDLQEEEGVIPFNWVDGKTVYWPPGTKPLNAMKCRQNPGKNWLKFPLIKLEFSSGSNIKDLDEVSMHLMSSSSSILSKVHVIFSKSNMWKGAVWNEDLQEEVIPSNWISDKTVCWLPGTKALTALKCREKLA
ncbi:uncharacterized protein LOC124810770 [Hydra vulgaris]|uniref:uncharacterized protein LOC124810770 n=1 Tax=Hydra vulgaris TaxID=6087 RepID=UPI001F5F4CBC|nr:uncharacterized protein LOC124810770 [Hydra vulgaris]